MPEGDTIHHAAARIRAALERRVPDEILTPHPRHPGARWAERLAGRAVRAVDAHGKHLFLRLARRASPWASIPGVASAR
jgi:endonuclease VIII